MSMAGTRTAMTDYIMAMAGQEAQHKTQPADAAPLAGIRVLEFCHTIMGPTAGLILADLGADVIKVEPAGGDSTRRLLGFAAGFFPAFNRNKRSIAVDLKSDDGRVLLHRLAATADVVLENYAPGTMERLGCGYADFAKINPRLIYCALKGFLSGPYEHRPALDEVVQFMAGLAYMTGPPGQPLRAGSSVVDIMGGMFAVIAIQAALRERERTGRGQLVKSALFESAAFLMAQHMAGEAVTGRASPPMPAREGAWAIYEPFPTADGEQIFVGLTSNRHWRSFCEHFQRHDLLQDPAYKTNEDRVHARPMLRPLVAAIIARHKLGELAELFDRIDIPFAPVAKPGDLFDDPQLNAGGRMLDIAFPNGVWAKIPRLPVEIGDHDMALRRQAPAIGEHTAEILAELGLEPGEIEALRQRDIVTVETRRQVKEKS
jgi:crotonobetainyl-CoA:carnitine CoA-transferase CaiB-like acyl-CoA transferase